AICSGRPRAAHASVSEFQVLASLREHMQEHATARDLTQHPAVRAWCDLHPLRTTPDEIAVLKDRKDSNVYRLSGGGRGGSNVIAKRCSRESALKERTIYERVLPHLPCPTLWYYGLQEEEGSEFCWVFVEDAAGEQYRPNTKEHCVLAAQW